MAYKTIAKISVMVLMAVLLLHSISHTLTDEQKVIMFQKPLVGLKGVQVLVEYMDPKAEGIGLTRDQIRTNVELRLRKAGIMVLTGKEMGEIPGRPIFYVNVNTLFLKQNPLIVYHIRLELQEWVTLGRGFETVGGIWNASTTGVVGPKQIGKVRELVGDLVDEFINNYLAANPKK